MVPGAGLALVIPNRYRICCCCAFAAEVPEPLRPVVRVARWAGVEPLRFWSDGSAPPRRSALTANAPRVRTARCRHVRSPP